MCDTNTNNNATLTDDADKDNTVAEYRWDGQDRRIVAAVYDDGQLDHTRHFYYHSHSIIEERVDGTANGDMDVQYVWGLQYVDELIARHDGTAWLFALCDANYRVTAIVNTSGAIVERYSYTPYGRRTALNPNGPKHTNPDTGSHNFTIGHQGLRHDESGLIYSTTAQERGSSSGGDAFFRALRGVGFRAGLWTGSAGCADN